MSHFDKNWSSHKLTTHWFESKLCSVWCMNTTMKAAESSPIIVRQQRSTRGCLLLPVFHSRPWQRERGAFVHGLHALSCYFREALDGSEVLNSYCSFSSPPSPGAASTLQSRLDRREWQTTIMPEFLKNWEFIGVGDIEFIGIEDFGVFLFARWIEGSIEFVNLFCLFGNWVCQFLMHGVEWWLNLRWEREALDGDGPVTSVCQNFDAQPWMVVFEGGLVQQILAAKGFKTKYQTIFF